MLKEVVRAASEIKGQQATENSSIAELRLDSLDVLDIVAEVEVVIDLELLTALEGRIESSSATLGELTDVLVDVVAASGAQ